MKDRKPIIDCSGHMYEIKMDDIRKVRKTMTNAKAHVVTGDIISTDAAPELKTTLMPLKQGR